MGHSLFSPSGAARWGNCLGSLTLARYVPKDEDNNKHSVEGTAAHALVAYCLEYGVDAFMLLEQDSFNGIDDYPTEAIEKLGMAGELWAKRKETLEDISHMVNHCFDLMDADFDIAIEQGVTLNGYAGKCWGTADFIAWDDANHHLHVIDYKNGFMPVDPASPQLLIYADAAMDTFGYSPDKITTTVVQPRAGGEIVKSSTMSFVELREALKPYKTAMSMYLENPIQPTKAGSWCKWCRAKSICQSFKDQTGDLDNLDIKAAMARVPSIELWLKETKKSAYGLLMQGANPKDVGAILTETSPHRKFRDAVKKDDRTIALEEALEAEFGDKGFTPKEPLSPAQVSKLPGGKSFVDEWAYKPKGSLVLGDINGKKPHVTPQATKERLTDIANS